MSHLVPCPECNRHVRVTEAACPFCALPLDLTGTPEPRLPRNRLSRAATLAFGATLASATALAACESSVVPVYGAPAGFGGLGEFDEAGAPAAGSSGVGTVGQGGVGGGGTAVPVYGAPAGGAPPISQGGASGDEAGASGDAGDASSAGKGGGGAVPVYGAAP